MPFRVLIVGAGSLGRALCHAFAGLTGGPVTVVVAARDRAAAADLCHTAGVTARLAGRAASFTATTAALDEPDGVAGLLRGAAPDGVVLCASLQSPWERERTPSAWTGLLARAGFGLGLPLQAELAVRIARELPRSRPVAWFVNAGFPDAVNPVLAALGLPVRCGVGNVATLAAGLQHALRLPDQSRLRLLAHHLHLHAPDNPADEALAWYDGAPVDDLGATLAGHRATGRRALNHVTGYAAAQVLDALVTGRELATHLPGPAGRPGGYPVLLRDGEPVLRLPPGWSERRAVELNQRWSQLDGAAVHGERVEFGAAAGAELAQYLPHLADGFAVAEISTACRDLLRLRERLRGRPVAGSATPSTLATPATAGPPEGRR